jgi:arylsulfatase A-like enzyme
MSRGRALVLSLTALLGLSIVAVRLLWVAPSRPPNVVLITLDTVRADVLTPYGGRGAMTAAAQRLAREGLLLENAYCPMPQTRPSLFSVLTSRYPRDHGVLNNVMPLKPGALTLPRVLGAHGYRTAGFVSSRLLDNSSGASQGFEEFDAPEGGTARTADETVPRTLRFLERTGGTDRPFFLWLHLFDPSARSRRGRPRAGG